MWPGWKRVRNQPGRVAGDAGRWAATPIYSYFRGLSSSIFPIDLYIIMLYNWYISQTQEIKKT